MKKIIKILIFGCLLLLGGVAELHAMDPEMKLIGAERYLESLEKVRDVLVTQVLGEYIQSLEEHTQNIETIEKELVNARADKPRGSRTQENIDYSIGILEQNLEDYEGFVTDIKKGALYPDYKKFKDLEESISSQEAEVEKLRADVEGVSKGEEEVEEVSKKFEIGQPEKKKKPFPTKTVVGVGLGVAAAVAAAGTLYAGLKWYQKKQIRRVIVQHGLELSAFLPSQKDVMAAAVLASYGIPGGMWYFRRIVQKGELASEVISAEIMWTILADLYYRKVPTIEEVQMLKERIVQ